MLPENFGVCTSEQTCQLKTHMVQKHVAHIRLTELNYVAGRVTDPFPPPPLLLSLLLLNSSLTLIHHPSSEYLQSLHHPQLLCFHRDIPLYQGYMIRISATRHLAFVCIQNQRAR